MNVNEPGVQRPHVIWVNGAFGVGKTTAAKLVATATPGAVVIDPEEIGSLLRPILQPRIPVRDFQEWRTWRVLTSAAINAVVAELSETPPQVIVVAQTITNEDYWHDITASLDDSIDLFPVVLHVDADEHRSRVTADTEESGAQQWRLSRFETFRTTAWILDSFTEIDVTDLTPESTASTILDAVSTRAQLSSKLHQVDTELSITPPADDPPPWPDDSGGPSYTNAEVDALIEEMKGDH